MADFGKLNFSVAFNPTSAFPIDARCIFTSYAAAEAAASTAQEVGSTSTVYYYGMKLMVYADGVVTWYEITTDKALKAEGGSVDLSEHPAGRIMSEDGDRGLSLYASEELSIVQKMQTIKKGLYTVYVQKGCPDNPTLSEELNSSLRGILNVNTYEGTYCYGWIILFDDQSNCYIQYVQQGAGKGWVHLNATSSGESSGETIDTSQFLKTSQVGSNLEIDENSKLNVTTASDFEGDNSRPITAAAVETIVGNVDALLETI